MKSTRIPILVFSALIFSVSIFIAAQQARAQEKVTICINFNPNGTSSEEGARVNLTPSGLTAAQQTAIATQVQSIYESVFGAGNVTVNILNDSTPCSGKLVRVSGGNSGDGKSFGWSNDIPGTTAQVYVNEFITRGYGGDSLVTALSETIAHEAGHLFGLEHNADSNNLMCRGTFVSMRRRITDHRMFTSDDSTNLRRNIVLKSVVPQQGDVAFAMPPATGNVTDEPSTDVNVSTSGYGITLGYLNHFGDIIYGSKLSPLSNDYSFSFRGNPSVNFAIGLNGNVYNSTNASLAMADPIGSGSGSFAQGMLSFNVPGVGSVPMFIDVPSSGSAGGINPMFNDYLLKNPFGGNVIKHSELDEFDVVVTPNYLDVEGEFDDDTWDAPLGTEIVDAGLEDEFFDPWTGEFVAYYWVLLNDGECFLLEFVTSYDSKETTFSTVDWLPLNPFIAGTSGANSIFDGPVTVIGGGTVARYDSTHSMWVEDTAGLNGTYVFSGSADTSGRIFVATSTGLFVQQNTTLTWTQTSFPPNYTSGVFADRFGRIFATNNTGPYKSTDHGTTWTIDTAGAPQSFRFTQYGDDAFGNIYTIANNYSSPSQLYRSLGGTSPWVQIAQSVTAQVFDKSTGYNFNRISGDSTLYLATTFGLYQSTDHGTTWTENNRFVHSSSYYSIVKNTIGKLFIGTDDGIFSGYYGDTSWQKLWPTSGMLNQNRKTLYLDASGTLHTIGVALSSFGNFGNAIARSTDGGQTWTQDSSNVGVVTQSGIFFADASGKEYIGTYGSSGVPMHIYSHPQSGPWAEDDHGFVSPASQFSSPTAFGSDGSSTYFAVTDSIWGLIWKNTAGTWALDTAGLNKDQIYSFGWNGHTLCAGGYYGVYQQNGNGWISFPFPKDVPGGANPFYVSVDSSGAVFSSFFTQLPSGNYGTDGVYFTKDQGQHWTRVNLANGIQINGLYSYQDSTYVLTTKGVFAFTSNLWARSYIPEGSHFGNTTTLHFGNVATGHQASIPIRITNFGNDSLRVTAYNSTNNAFTLTKIPAAVGPGQVLNAQLQFLPNAIGASQATIVLASNSIAGPDTIFADGTAGTNGVSEMAPQSILSLESYPNPFASTTTIQYALAARVGVTLTIFDVLGQQIATLASDVEDAGPHSVSFPAAGLANGTYIARLQAGSNVVSRQISIVR